MIDCEIKLACFQSVNILYMTVFIVDFSQNNSTHCAKLRDYPI